MSFSSQHYEKVAAVFRSLDDQLNKKEVVDAFVEMFKEDNGRFKENLFICACFTEDGED